MKKLNIGSSLLKISLFLSLAATGAVSQAADETVAKRYKASCVMCHSGAVPGAPKTGDAAQWAPRLEKGMDALVNSVDKGLNAMPPKGMCFDCTADDYKALIEYMSAGK